MPMRAEPSRSLVAATDLWELALQRQAIDPAELMAAVERQLRIGDPDFRTSLLIRDAFER